MSNSKFYKGSLDTIILKLLSEGNSMYGYEITQKVKKLTNGQLKITEGALYPALHKLEGKNLLTTETKKVEGRLRKYYSLTEEGVLETEEQLIEMEGFLNTLQLILDPKFSID